MNIDNPRRAAALRDDAARRVRRATAVAIAGATALTGIFTAIAAGSTHAAKRTVTVPVKRAKVSASKSTASAKVTAPTPPLVQNGSGAAPAPPPESASGAPVVTQSSAPPVVVSGGS